MDHRMKEYWLRGFALPNKLRPLVDYKSEPIYGERP
jgi:hypothetical protein